MRFLIAIDIEQTVRTLILFLWAQKKSIIEFHRKVIAIYAFDDAPVFEHKTNSPDKIASPKTAQRRPLT